MPSTVLVPGWPWNLSDGRLFYGGMTPVRGADLSTFRPLSDFWGRDARQVYCGGSVIRGADPESFVVLNRLYARDAHRAYTIKGPIPDADPATFRAIGPTEHPFNTTNGYAVDARAVYHTTEGGKGSVVSRADAATFEALGGGYARDRSAVYWQRHTLPGAKPDEWQPLQGPHSRAGAAAYCLHKRIRGADGRRLEPLPTLAMGEYWARDGAAYFRWIEAADGRAYWSAFSGTFICTGRVTGIRLFLDGVELPAESPSSWDVAQRCEVEIICGEWLQEPNVAFESLPRPGAAFRFGALCEPYLCDGEWAAGSRIWIFRVVPNYARADGLPLQLEASALWWECLPATEVRRMMAWITEAAAAK